MKKQRQHYALDYKRRIVAEYLSGTISVDNLAKREDLVRSQIYTRRVQLERRERMSRIERIAETEGVSIEQARTRRGTRRDPAKARPDDAGKRPFKKTPAELCARERTQRSPVHYPGARAALPRTDVISW